MDSCADTLAGGLPHSDIHGSTPARGSPWLFAACHVLHRLLVPRHPPNALLILDIPMQTVRSASHHAQKPSSGRRIDLAMRPKDSPWKYRVFRNTYNSTQTATAPIACAITTGSIPVELFIAPLIPRRPTVGAPISRSTLPVRQVGRTAGRWICPETDLASHAPRDAPEPDSHVKRTVAAVCTAAASA